MRRRGLACLSATHTSAAPPDEKMVFAEAKTILRRSVPLVRSAANQTFL